MTRIKKILSEIKIKNVLFCLLGGSILALGMYNIHSVSAVTEGGTLGLALLFENWFGISPAISEAVLNIICYIIGIRVLGKKFIVYSAASTAAFSISYRVLECFPRVYPEIGQYPLLAAVLGAVFVGVGVGICVRMGGAPCGDDALAMTLSRVTKMKIQWMYLITDLSVLALSLTYIEPRRIIYSLVTVVISGQIIGRMQGRMSVPLPGADEGTRMR